MDELDKFDLEILNNFGYEIVNGYVRQVYSDGQRESLVFHLNEIRRVEIQNVPVIRKDGSFDRGYRMYITLASAWYVWTVPLPPSREDEIRALVQAFLRMRDTALGFDPDVKYLIRVETKSLDSSPVVNW